MRVELRDVSLKIAEQDILDTINLHVESGEFVTIIGPNGSGKSSFVKAMMNQVNYRGEILFEQQERKKISTRTFSQNVAVLSQFHEIVEHITVEEMLAYGRLPHKSLFSRMSKQDKGVIEEIIQWCDLSHLKTRMLDTLSGGEKQRVFLGMCLIQEPKVLILDEPTNHLDIRYQIQLLQIVKRLNHEKKITVICVLHDINQALRLSDKVAMMKDGSLHYYGKPHGVLDAQIIEEVFQIPIEVWQNDTELFVDCLKNLK